MTTKIPANKFDAQSFEFLQRVIRIGHNRAVKRYFRDQESDTSTSTGRGVVKTALLIRDEDSAQETLLKMQYFKLYLETETSSILPDGWQIKRGQDIPQLAIIYRNSDRKSISGDYPLYIPHYNGSRKPKIPSYNKGNHWARWKLSDNSQIIINAKTAAEAKRIIKILEKLVDRRFRTPENPNLVQGQTAKGTYKEFKAVPIRADYFPEGKKSLIPKWREYF